MRRPRVGLRVVATAMAAGLLAAWLVSAAGVGLVASWGRVGVALSAGALTAEIDQNAVAPTGRDLWIAVVPGRVTWWPEIRHQPGTQNSPPLLVLSLPLWMPAGAAMAWAGLLRRPSRKPKPGHCPRCGYDRRGIPGVCPECGDGRPL